MTTDKVEILYEQVIFPFVSCRGAGHGPATEYSNLGHKCLPHHLLIDYDR